MQNKNQKKEQLAERTGAKFQTTNHLKSLWRFLQDIKIWQWEQLFEHVLNMVLDHLKSKNPYSFDR